LRESGAEHAGRGLAPREKRSRSRQGKVAELFRRRGGRREASPRRAHRNPRCHGPRARQTDEGGDEMGKARPRTGVLDAGALIAFERGDARMRALVREAVKTGTRVVIPAGVLGQVWHGAARQAPLPALVKGPTTVVPALDQVLAEASGVLCGRAGTR